MIIVFGITGTDFRVPDGLRGVGNPPRQPFLTVHGGLAAVIAELDEQPRTRADLQAYVEVMGALAEAGTIVPMRFGTLVDDEEAVRRDIIDRHHDALADVLRTLDGCVQMTLKGIYEEDVVLREVLQAHPELQRSSQRGQSRAAMIALGERVAAAVEQSRAADEQRIAAIVDEHAERVVVEAPGHERVAVRLQILVRRDRRDDLDAAVLGLRVEQEGRMSIKYTGPIAPYSFSDFSLEAAAWA